MKKILVLIMAICIMITGNVVYAEDSVNVSVSYNSAEGSITLSGYSIGRATVTVVPFGTELSTLSVGNKPVVMKQIVTDGNYTHKLLLPVALTSGKYDVYIISVHGSDKDYFSYINLESGAVERLSGIPTLEEYISIAEENANDLGIDTTDEKYEENKNEIFSLLYKFNTDYTDAALYNTNYQKMYAVAEITGGTKEEVEAMLLKFQAQLEIDFTKDYAEDSRINETEKGVLCTLLSKTDFFAEFEERENTDFNVIFEELKGVSAVSCAGIWQDIQDAVEKEFDTFRHLLNYKNFKSIKDKDSVYSKIMTDYREFASLKDFEDAFKDCADKIYKAERNKQEIPATAPDVEVNTGGSFGGGGFSGGVTTPSVMEEKFPYEFKMNYSDFDKSHWSYDAVYSLAEKSIINGYKDNTFKPDKYITRAEFVKIIMAAKGQFNIKLDELSNGEFTDVTEDMWHYEYISKAGKLGLVNGNEGLFNPDETITREDAAVIMHRFLSKKYSISGNKIFADRGQISSYAKGPIAALAAAGIISGVGDNHFAPKHSLTRSQAAQIIFNCINYAERMEKNYEN